MSTSSAPFASPLEAMQSLLGLSEVAGPGSNPHILDLAKDVAAIPELGWIAGFYKDDQIPWCGLAMAWAAVKSGSVPPRPNPLSARAWANWGLPLDGPMLGAVCVLSRGPGLGHVGLVTAQSSDGAFVSLIGGNEADAVRIANFSTKNVIAYRRPVTLAQLAPAPLLGAGSPAKEVTTA